MRVIIAMDEDDSFIEAEQLRAKMKVDLRPEYGDIDVAIWTEYAG